MRTPWYALTLRGARKLGAKVEVDQEFDRLWREADEATERLRAAIDRESQDGWVPLIDLPEYADWKVKATVFREAAEQLLRVRASDAAYDVC